MKPKTQAWLYLALAGWFLFLALTHPVSSFWTLLDLALAVVYIIYGRIWWNRHKKTITEMRPATLFDLVWAVGAIICVLGHGTVDLVVGLAMLFIGLGMGWGTR